MKNTDERRISEQLEQSRQQHAARIEAHRVAVETFECRIHGVPLVEVYRAAVSMQIVCPGDSAETVVDRAVEIARLLAPEPVVPVVPMTAEMRIDGLGGPGGSHV